MSTQFSPFRILIVRVALLIVAILNLNVHVKHRLCVNRGELLVGIDPVAGDVTKQILR